MVNNVSLNLHDSLRYSVHMTYSICQLGIEARLQYSKIFGKLRIEGSWVKKNNAHLHCLNIFCSHFNCEKLGDSEKSNNLEFLAGNW